MRDEDLDRLLPPGGALSGRLFSRLIASGQDDPPLPPGTFVGYWCVGRLLGRGGSSMVYLADRADGQFEQQVALKIVRPNQSLTEHFRRERQILAELRHPAIAQLIDGGQMEGGRLWFAMEPVFGERIDRYVREHRMPLADRLALFDAACEAVAYAHSRLLVHRDIKPGNLLVDESGRPRLLDFGIATSSDVVDDVFEHAMTPTYASPEQRSGGAITTASDVYQLGLLLGVMVMPGGEPCATLPRPVRAVVGAELSAIIAHATEHDLAHRYPTVASLRSDIAAIRQRRPVSVIGGLRYPVGRFLERHAAPSAIAATAVLTLLSTGWIAAHRVGIERDQATASALRAKATSDFLVGLFSVSDPGENRGEKLTANQLLARGAAQLRRTSNKDPGQMAAVALEIGRVYMELGEFTRARDVLTSAIQAGESALPPHAPERLQLLTLRGRASYFLSDYDAAAKDFAAARRGLDTLVDPAQRDAEEGAVATQEAQLARRLGKLDEALAKQTRAVDLLTRAPTPDDAQVGLAWNNMGLVARDRGDYVAAENAYEHAISAYRYHYGDDHPRTRGSIGNLAELLIMKEEDARAEPLLVENIERYRTLQEGPSTRLLQDMIMLSQVRLDQKRNDEAAALAQEADDGYVKLFGPDHNYRAYALVMLGHARLGMNDGAGALDAFQEALRLRRLAFGADHLEVATSWDNLGQAYLHLGNAMSAEPVLREALRIRAHTLPADHVMLPRTRMRLVKTLIELHRNEEAATEFARATRELEVTTADTAADRKSLAELGDLLTPSSR